MKRTSAGALAALLLVAGCGDEGLTQFFVCYEIDPALVADSTQTRVCVRDDDGAALFGCDGEGALTLGRTGETASQAIVGHGSVTITLEADVVRRVAGGSTTTVTFSQRVQATPLDGEIVDLKLRLTEGCLERPACDAGETCVEDACVPVDVSARCLTPRGTPPSLDCDDPRLTSSCPAP